MARLGGFEPPTAWFVARYSIQLSYSRLKLICDVGAAGRIRTSDRLVRSQVLYPAELQPHIDHLLWLSATSTCLSFLKKEMAEREGFEPSVRLLVRFLSRELVSATHPPLLENGAYTTIIFLFS